ncbi:MAG: response regulator [Phycisphaerae bacterium]|nr:response regulator [Phycisphaerae bacterium]
MAETSEKVGGKILIVDDYPANVKLLERNLRTAGYETLAAYDGAEALEKVASERPDLILLDIMLPKIDGYEVCHRLRADEATAVIPIIMITALKDTADRIRGLEAGADDFISKPFDRGELLARVKSLLQIKYYRSMLAEREKFHAVIQDLSHGIIITDADGRIQTISRRAAELLDVAGEDFVGRKIEEALERFEVEPSLEALRALSGARSVTVDLAQRKVRSPRYLAGRYTRILGRGGELYNTAMVFRDITEMRQKEKLKRDFLSLMSHKLKTPLTIIGGYLNLIDRGKYGQVPPPVADAIRVTLAKVQELSDLIEKVLTYAGLTATELERAGQLVSLADLVGHVRERIEQRYPNRAIVWRVLVPRDLPRARAPEELLSIVLDNLLDNAVKFTRAPEARVEVTAEEIADRRLRVRVCDNGPGVASEDREKVFAEFTQVEEDFTGSVAGMGLGLSTAKRLVESWGGRIGLEVPPERGSAFFFTVPSEHTPAGNSHQEHSQD